MKKTAWRVLPILVAAVFSFANTTYATPTVGSCSQTNYTGITGLTASGLCETMNPDTDVTGLTVYFSANSVAAGDWSLKISDDVTQTCTVVSTQLPAAGTGLEHFTFATTTLNNMGHARFGFYNNLTCAGGVYNVADLRMAGDADAYPYTVWDILNPDGDGNLSTHIIRITSPVAYSTTTSPVPIGFDIYTSSTSPPMGYDITFTNTLTYESRIVSGWLVDSGFNSGNYDATFHVSTSTALTGDGTWKVTIALWTGGNGGPEPDPAGTQYLYFGTPLTTWFGLNYNDNAQHVVFPPAVFSYSSTSCALDFSGTFSVDGCAGYLFYPTVETLQAYPTLYTSMQEKIPFSYFFSVVNTWQSLQASTTQNLPTYAYDLHDLGIGSTSPMGNILPNFVGLSSSTVSTYLSPNIMALLKAIASAALILALFADIFFTVRNMIKV